MSYLFTQYAIHKFVEFYRHTFNEHIKYTTHAFQIGRIFTFWLLLQCENDATTMASNIQRHGKNKYA